MPRQGPIVTWRTLANPVVPGMYGPVLAWLAAREPATVEQAATALFPKDVLRARLTGTVGTDRSDGPAVSTDGSFCSTAAVLPVPSTRNNFGRK